MKLIDDIVEISKQPLSPEKDFLAKVLPIFVFFFFFPALLFFLPKVVFDPWLRLPTLFRFSIRIIPAGALIVLGLFFVITSTKAQREIGKGTPMPLKATQKLVVEKPYSYCRNPLYFGLINFFSGISILIGSISSLIMVFIYASIIMLYTRLIEERELGKRFGDDYLAYKATTPFIIPGLHLIRRNTK
ncbi:MAG: isoprenylcysteine carboxylmethyltransferase family protein [Chloroflexi bacterium]|jgi:protein-S-isoprenylcysteine O-methyltransferase Ste14|nr:isoprenylcysteine carboxylmethyltransferase family protein [Chloroflexota bacterium]